MKKTLLKMVVAHGGPFSVFIGELRFSVSSVRMGRLNPKAGQCNSL